MTPCPSVLRGSEAPGPDDGDRFFESFQYRIPAETPPDIFTPLESPSRVKCLQDPTEIVQVLVTVSTARFLHEPGNDPSPSSDYRLSVGPRLQRQNRQALLPGRYRNCEASIEKLTFGLFVHDAQVLGRAWD